MLLIVLLVVLPSIVDNVALYYTFDSAVLLLGSYYGTIVVLLSTVLLIMLPCPHSNVPVQGRMLNNYCSGMNRCLVSLHWGVGSFNCAIDCLPAFSLFPPCSCLQQAKVEH